MGASLTTDDATIVSWVARAWLAHARVDPRLGSVVLAPHQVEAVARLRDLLDEFGGAVLADEAGLGKTYVALAIAREAAAFRVVAPASLRDMWHQAFVRTGVHGTFISHETLSQTHGAVGLPTHPLIIVDEAHHVRSVQAHRYGALAHLAWGARLLLLTATPVHNRLGDLRSQLALFLGSAAFSLGPAALARLVVRRRHESLGQEHRLPAVEPVHWLGVDPAPRVLSAIAALPQAVPPADGGEAHALLRLGLLRAWMSSDAALRSALRRRLQRAAALSDALAAGRLPTRAELRTWTIVDDAVQLAFPELAADTPAPTNAAALRATIAAHVDGIHRIRRALEASGAADACRLEHLRALRRRHAGIPIVAFTHFAETALGLARRLTHDSGVALVTARGARIATGPISRREIIEHLAPEGDPYGDRRLPVELVITTDVLSEGLNLQQAGVLVHLDLPWTVARLEQRLGRLRRPGSPHARVHAYAIGPPAHARELLTIVRALQRKARLVRALVGAPELAVHEPLLGARLRRTTTEPDEDVTGATEALRHELQAWGTGGDPRDDVDGDLTGASVAVRVGPTADVPWCALALVGVGGRHRLVAAEPGIVSDEPRFLLEIARRWSAAVPHDGAAPDDRAAVARAAIEQWLAERRAAALAAPVLDTPSTAHAHVLRRLDAIVARAPRHERPAITDVVSRCRALVLASRGAGAERFLSSWLQEYAADGEGALQVAQIHALASVLAPRVSRAATAPLNPAPRLGVLLLVIERE